MKKIYFYLVASLFSVMLVSATPTTGLQFSGVATSYIDLGQQAAFSPTQFTIEAWVNFQSLSGAYLLSTEGSSAASGGNQGFVLQVNGGKFRLQVGNGTDWPNVTGATTLSLSTWYHVAATYTGTEMKLYVNGVLDGTAGITTPMVISVQNLCIGEGSMWKDRRFTGKMADLRFWNAVRTESEIAANMSTPLSGTETGLVSNWKMNEGAGTSVADVKGAYNITKPADVAWFIPTLEQEISVVTPSKGLVFDGSKANSLVDMGAVAAIASPAEFTVEALVNYTSTSGGYILSSEGSPVAGQEQGFSLRMNGDKIDFTIGANGSWPQIISSNSTVLNTWYHVAATYSAAAMKLYVNGLEVASLTSPAAIGASSQNVIMGEGSMWKGRGLNGKLGYVRMWSVAKTKQEIRDNANIYVTGTEANLLAAWNNNVQNTTTLADMKGAFTGTIGSGVVWFGTASGVNSVYNNSTNIEAVFSGRTLLVTNKSASGLQLSIYSMTGQKIMNESISAGNKFEKQLTIQKGAYIMSSVGLDGSTYTKKFIITE